MDRVGKEAVRYITNWNGRLQVSGWHGFVWHNDDIPIFHTAFRYKGFQSGILIFCSWAKFDWMRRSFPNADWQSHYGSIDGSDYIMSNRMLMLSENQEEMTELPLDEYRVVQSSCRQ